LPPSGSNENFELNDGQRHGHKGSRGGSFSYRRGGRGQYRRGRGGYHNQRQQYEGYEEAPADGAVGVRYCFFLMKYKISINKIQQLWNGPDKERGKGQKPRYSRGGGGAGAPRQRTKSEKSSCKNCYCALSNLIAFQNNFVKFCSNKLTYIY